MTTRREFATDESQNRKVISTALSTNVSSSSESTDSATLCPGTAWDGSAARGDQRYPGAMARRAVDL